MKKYQPIRLKNFSFLLNIKATAIISICTLLLFALFLLSAGMGELFIGPFKIIGILFGQGLEFESFYF